MAHTLPSDIIDTCDGLVYCFALWAYNVTGGYFWTIILTAFVVALTMATQRLGYARSFGFSMVVGLLGAIWLATLQLMPWWTASIFILLGGLGIVIMVLNEK